MTATWVVGRGGRIKVAIGRTTGLDHVPYSGCTTDWHCRTGYRCSRLSEFSDETESRAPQRCGREEPTRGRSKDGNGVRSAADVARTESDTFEKQTGAKTWAIRVGIRGACGGVEGDEREGSVHTAAVQEKQTAANGGKDRTVPSALSQALL